MILVVLCPNMIKIPYPYKRCVSSKHKEEWIFLTLPPCECVKRKGQLDDIFQGMSRHQEVLECYSNLQEFTEFFESHRPFHGLSFFCSLRSWWIDHDRPKVYLESLCCRMLSLGDGRWCRVEVQFVGEVYDFWGKHRSTMRCWSLWLTVYCTVCVFPDRK